MLRRALTKQELRAIAELQKLLVHPRYKRGSLPKTYSDSQAVLGKLLSHDLATLGHLQLYIQKIEDVVGEGRRLAEIIGRTKNKQIKRTKEKKYAVLNSVPDQSKVKSPSPRSRSRNQKVRPRKNAA